MLRDLMRNRKWKSLLLYPRFQLAFVAYALAGALLIGLVLQVTNAWLVRRFVEDGVRLGLAPEHPYFVYMAEQQRIFDKVFLITLSSSILLLVVGGLALSHRVAGPLSRLRHHLLEISAGKSPGPLRFRNGDYFRDLAEICNSAMAGRKPEEPES